MPESRDNARRLRPKPAAPAQGADDFSHRLSWPATIRATICLFLGLLLIGLIALAAFDDPSVARVDDDAPAVPSAPKTRRLQVALDAQREQVEAIAERLETSAARNDDLHERLAALTDRRPDPARPSARAHAGPRRLEDIVAQKSLQLKSRQAASALERQTAATVKALSGDTGLPEARIKAALGR